MTADQCRPLRADAQRNLERITASARALFAERGVSVQMEDIAAHAGVGVGTLYRRFPTKESLMTALVRDRFQEFAVIATEVEALSLEPYEALVTVMRRHAETVEHDAAFQLAMMNINTIHWEGIEEDKRAVSAVVTRIIDRARKAGAVRKDFRFEDYAMLMCANTATMHFMHEAGIWRRHLDIVLAGLRA